ncbi:Dystroglycan (Dystrophin-associated glycoprotein 1) [Mactra antiquata]
MKIKVCTHSQGKMENFRKMVSVAIVTIFCVLSSVNGEKAVLEMKQQPLSEPLSLLWGIADTTGYVGKLFKYMLPNDAFQGNIVHYHITEAGKDKLPEWLTFNPLKTELKGIPGPSDKGVIYLEVKVIGDDNSHADDVFAIDILDTTNGPAGTVASRNGDSPKVVHCSRDEPQTIVTVVVDCDLEIMGPEEKITLLNSMVGHLNLAPEMLTIMPVGNKPMFDSGALVVGPGNQKEPKTAGTLVSWMVGCGQVARDHMILLQEVEAAASNGDMSSTIGHGIIGWHVTNTRFQAKKRKRRQVTETPTQQPPAPTTTLIQPSSTVIVSSSISITPTKTADVMPTKMPDGTTSSSSSSSSTSSTMIKPSTTTKTSSSEASTESTEMLPSKTFIMTSSVISETSSSETMTKTQIMPTSTSSTTKKTEVVTVPSTTGTTTESTTEKTTEKVTPKPTSPPRCPPRGSRNKPPVVENPLKNMNFAAGSIIRKKIPENTFFDCYDKETSGLALSLTFDNDEPLPDGFWLQLNKRTLRPYVIVSNPLNTDAGSYDFKLTATNFYGRSASQSFVIVVEGEEMAESFPNHELSMTLDTDYDEFMSSLDNRIELSGKVAKIFGDKNANSLKVTRLERGSVVYAWTNESMASNDCPSDELKDLFSRMFNEDGSLTQDAQDAMQPYTINAAESRPLGSCTNNPNFPVREARRPVLSTSKPTDKVTTPKKTTKPPSVKTTRKPVVTSKTTPETTTAAVAAAGAGSGGSDIWITTVVPAIVVVVVLIIALIIACCLYRKRRKGKMKLEEKNRLSNNKGVPVIFADEYEEKPNDSTLPLILKDEKPPMPPPEYQRASSETSGNSNSTQPIEDNTIEEIEMENASEISPLYSPPPPVTASNYNKPPHVQSSRGPPPYVPP